MTPEQLEAQSREAIKAWCDDPSVQLEFTFKGVNLWGPKIISVGEFDLNDCYYRIAKPKKWYRVALLKRGDTITVDNESHENSITKSTAFIKWLDERKYYD